MWENGNISKCKHVVIRVLTTFKYSWTGSSKVHAEGESASLAGAVQNPCEVWASYENSGPRPAVGDRRQEGQASAGDC